MRPFLIAAAAFITSPVFAQTHTTTMHGGTMQAAPLEPGQDTFGAIAEIVDILRADPDTDWSRVNLESLRVHLLEMDALVTTLEVTERETSDGLVMTVHRSSPGAEAAWRMVPAHQSVLETETGWRSRVEIGKDTLFWTVTDRSDATEITALGFFGLMATGDHHPEHHLMVALGDEGH